MSNILYNVFTNMIFTDTCTIVNMDSYQLLTQVCKSGNDYAFGLLKVISKCGKPSRPKRNQYQVNTIMPVSIKWPFFSQMYETNGRQDCKSYAWIDILNMKTTKQ